MRAPVSAALTARERRFGVAWQGGFAVLSAAVGGLLGFLAQPSAAAVLVPTGAVVGVLLWSCWLCHRFLSTRLGRWTAWAALALAAGLVALLWAPSSGGCAAGGSACARDAAILFFVGAFLVLLAMVLTLLASGLQKLVRPVWRRLLALVSSSGRKE